MNRKKTFILWDLEYNICSNFEHKQKIIDFIKTYKSIIFNIYNL